MKAFINRGEIIIFRGATIGDLVLAYSKRSYKMMREGKLYIFDQFGNITEPDGPVSEGQVFTLRRGDSNRRV